ncbi:MAG: hypothetical protein ACSHYA_16190 [Opitutaceae bacterium]
MEDKKNLPKFNLAKKVPDENTNDHIEENSPEEETTKSKLKLKSSGPAYPETPMDSDSKRVAVTDILDDAYAPDKERANKSAIHKGISNTAFTFGIIASSIFLIFAYAHIWKSWPPLELKSWYTPFVVSTLLSALCIIKGIKIYNHERSYSMLITGILAAAALCYLNAFVLKIAAQPNFYAPDSILWEAENDFERLLAYEINATRGWITSPEKYTELSMAHYKNTFRSTPKSEWKPYFKKHLTFAELDSTTTINIHERMSLVSTRMLKHRQEQWNNFDSRYQTPSFLFIMKRAVIMPYIYCFKIL